MTVRLTALVLDAGRPSALARFWADALRWELGGGADRPVLTPTDPTTFEVMLRPSSVDKVGQNRIHIDLTTASIDEYDTTIADLLRGGAAHIDIGQSPDESHVVLADPEGNELCVIDPGNRFLASCPRLGAVNCDGTAALGHFWSAALGWPLVWDQDEETAIQAPSGTGPKITWSGPPLMPRHEPERLHFHVAPAVGATLDAALAELIALGATQTDAGHGCPDAIALTDVDGNAICLVAA